MFKAISASFIHDLVRKKERNTEQNNYLFQEEVGQLKIHLSNQKIPHKKKKTQVNTNCDLLMSYEVSGIHLVKKRK